MARTLKATRQEATLIRGSLIEMTAAYFWIVDADGNRLALSWHEKNAARLTDALDFLEDFEAMERRQ